jgi:imidazolonepropionase-like amidohydrolase
LPWEARHADDGGPSGIADSPWGFRAKVRQNAKYGVDVIKFMGSGGVLSHGDSVGGQQLTQEEMDAIVSEAHMWGRKVAVHAHGTEAIKAAIRAGVDSVEHASLIDDEGIRMAKAKGVYLDMDVYDDDYILAEGARNGVEPASMDKERSIGRLQRENFQKAWKAGAKMAFATDAGVYPHRRTDGLGRPHRPHRARLLRRHRRGGGRPAEGRHHAAAHGLRHEGRRGGEGRALTRMVPSAMDRGDR